jgi:hypothetical protein
VCINTHFGSFNTVYTRRVFPVMCVYIMCVCSFWISATVYIYDLVFLVLLNNILSLLHVYVCSYAVGCFFSYTLKFSVPLYASKLFSFQPHTVDKFILFNMTLANCVLIHVACTFCLHRQSVFKIVE